MKLRVERRRKNKYEEKKNAKSQSLKKTKRVKMFAKY